MDNFVSSVPVGPPEAEIVALDAAKFFLGSPSGADDLINALIMAARQAAENYTWRSLSKKAYLQTHDRFPGQHQDGILGQVGHRVYVRGDWRSQQVIKIWHPPLISIDNVTYVGLDGEDHSLTAGTDFQVDPVSEPGRIAPLPGQLWPAVMRGVLNGVRIAYTAGYEVKSASEPTGEATDNSQAEPESLQVAGAPPSPTQQVTSYTLDRTIPEPIVTAIKQTIVHWFQNRDPVIAQAGAGGKFATLPLHVEYILNSYRCMDFSLTGS